MQKKANTVTQFRNRKLLTLIASGTSLSQAAKECGINRSYASTIVNKSTEAFELQAETNLLMSDIMHQRLPQLVTEMLHFLGKELTGGATRNKFKAAALIIMLIRHTNLELEPAILANLGIQNLEDLPENPGTHKLED